MKNEYKKRDEYLDLAREQNKLWKINLTMVAIVIVTIPKSLVKGLEKLKIKWVKAIQTTAFLRSTRILRRVLENCWHSDSSERLSANGCVKNSPEVIIIIFIENGISDAISKPGSGCLPILSWLGSVSRTTYIKKSFDKNNKDVDTGQRVVRVMK